jgi:hypothetical protein
MSIMMVIGFQALGWATNVRAGDAAGSGGMLTVAAGVWWTFSLVGLGTLALNGAGQHRMESEPPRSTGSMEAKATLSLRVLVGLAAILLIFVGQGAFWAFMQVLGVLDGQYGHPRH